MKFKHFAIGTLAVLAALAVTGCAKNPSTEANAAAKRYFDAWMKINYPSATASGLGIYIIEDTPGNGAAYPAETPYAMLKYTARDLDGIISDSNVEAIVQQLGAYNKTYYYGPKVFRITSNYAGLENALSGMRIGGKRKVIIPSWLMTYYRYDTPADYLSVESGNSNTIYDIELCDFTDDINKWQVDSIERYLARTLGHVDSSYVGGDTTAAKYGFYFKLLRESPDTVTIRSDSTFYINYIGRLLNGQVFDTTIEDTAKVYGIYSASRTYGPVTVKKGEKYSEVKMGDTDATTEGSSVIDGFGGAIFLMQPYEKATTVFYSPLGYKESGQGNMLPPYSPLRFDIELVDAP